MKKIILLGGTAQQVPAIKYAKNKGYYTILCDYLEDNVGQKYADAFYLESTTDKEKILEIAIKENIDGIIAYASDPAAVTAAYVSEKLNLETNPYNSVKILSNKKKFREFLKNNNFKTPFAENYVDFIDLKKNINKFRFPILIKPTDSSGSKGITKLYNLNGLENAFEIAKSGSRENVVIVEEFIEKSHQYLVGGDIFVLDGKLKFLGLMNCHRDFNVNPLVPVGKSYPAFINDIQLKKIQEGIEKIITLLNLKFGGFNIELIFDKNDDLYFIEIGPRSGGNMIPELLTLISGINMMELTVDKAMGQTVLFPEIKSNEFYASHNIHTNQNGQLKSIKFDTKLDEYIIKKEIYKRNGDHIEFFDSSNKTLGIIFMKFSNQAEMSEILENINNLIQIEVR